LKVEEKRKHSIRKRQRGRGRISRLGQMICSHKGLMDRTHDSFNMLLKPFADQMKLDTDLSGHGLRAEYDLVQHQLKAENDLGERRFKADERAQNLKLLETLGRGTISQQLHQNFMASH